MTSGKRFSLEKLTNSLSIRRSDSSLREAPLTGQSILEVLLNEEHSERAREGCFFNSPQKTLQILVFYFSCGFNSFFPARIKCPSRPGYSGVGREYRSKHFRVQSTLWYLKWKLSDGY